VVVDDPVDAPHLVDDAGRRSGQEGGIERIHIGGHAVFGGDRPKRTGRLVGAGVAHHPDGPHRQQHREGLPDRIVQPGFPYLFEEDAVHST